MTPVKPHWTQPSHPDIQQVIVNEAAFSSKSLSRVSLTPGAIYAKLDFPPCSIAPGPSYASVQMGRDGHLLLNSDLMYINHSCEPSVIIDTQAMAILAGPNGLRSGEELTFFYPSTEWHLAQPFSCLCKTRSCRGTISGARDMSSPQLDGYWLNQHIRELLAERDALSRGKDTVSVGGPVSYGAGEAKSGSMRRGPTSRELSGEMGGDTSRM